MTAAMRGQQAPSYRKRAQLTTAALRGRGFRTWRVDVMPILHRQSAAEVVCPSAAPVASAEKSREVVAFKLTDCSFCKARVLQRRVTTDGRKRQTMHYASESKNTGSEAQAKYTRRRAGYTQQCPGVSRQGYPHKRRSDYTTAAAGATG